MLSIILIIFTISFLVIVSWRDYSTRNRLPCPAWLGWMVELDNPFARTHKALTIIQNLRLEKGMLAIDIGCGPGRVTVPLAKAIGPEGLVVAMDRQSDMLEKVKKKAKEHKIKNIQYLYSEITEASIEKDKFDRAILVSVLGEIPNKKEALKQIFKCLKPGGILSITETIFDPHFQRKSHVLRLAHEVGFIVQDKFGGALVYTVNFEKP